jgi:DNA uptake protein ComE-like DNA-binding protein
MVVVVLLALGAYTFCETMISESEATVMFGRKVQTRAFADSGVEYAAALLGGMSERSCVSFYDRPESFQGVLLLPADHPRGRGRFSLVAPSDFDPEGGTVRFGGTDESGKLNLNLIVDWERRDRFVDGQARGMLLHLPGMTHETADAILDWLDEDERPRRYGAESEFYQQLERPYRAKNGPLDTLDELLLVRGVTPELLFGEDFDRNGLLESNEDDGDVSRPADNADGVLQRGWAAYVTIHSRESNLRADGRRRINLNQESLGQLFEELTAEFGDDTADLIVAMRREGEDVPEQPEDEEQNEGAPEEDGGDPLQAAGHSRIGSVYDLIDAEVTQGDGTRPTRRTPWTADPNTLRRYLPRLLDTLTTHEAPFVDGRVNIHTAPREVLLGVPGMTESLADAIVARQALLFTGRPSATLLANHRTTAWLLLEGLVTLPEMRQLDRYITGLGGVFRVQSVGYFDSGGPVTRLEAVIDATEQPPRIVLFRDLTELGKGYDLGAWE